jgi:ADP-heptose:LPS heptosyltransferase
MDRRANWARFHRVAPDLGWILGIGDQIIASGLAREAWTKRGRKVAFGSNGKIIWDKHSEEIFRNNPNICFPGNESRNKLEWVEFHKGHRGYNTQGDGHWIWNLDWRCVPGEIYLTHGEETAGKRHGKDFAVIEPNVATWKSSAENKKWGVDRYQQVCDALIADGTTVLQFIGQDDGFMLRGAKTVRTKTFRDAVAILKNSALYIGAEGGLHHAAAAVGVRGVVMFGGFIPPSVTGYEFHRNMVGSDRFCGSFKTCPHCADAMAAISVDSVYQAAKEILRG